MQLLYNDHLGYIYMQYSRQTFLYYNFDLNVYCDLNVILILHNNPLFFFFTFVSRIYYVCIKGRPIYMYIMRGSRWRGWVWGWVYAPLLDKFKFVKFTVYYSKHSCPSEISRKYSESTHVSMITKNHLIWT